MTRWSELTAAQAIERAAVAKARAEAIWAPVAVFPSTNGRIWASIVAMLATTVAVVVTHWEPTWEWLAFLMAWGGLDLAQFGWKRVTATEHTLAKQGISPAEPTKPPEVGA